jgi:hypothetical protein
MGYDESLAKQIRAEGGFLAMMFYRQLFDPYSVERVLAEYPNAVIDCGAGVGPYENQQKLKRIRELFEPIPNIFLLLPSPDVAKHQILLERDINPPADLKFDINAHFYTIWLPDAGEHIIYNEPDSEQTCDE